MPHNNPHPPTTPPKKWAAPSVAETALDHIQEAVFLIDHQKTLHPINHKAKQHFDEFESVRCREAFLCSAKHINSTDHCGSCGFQRTFIKREETEYIYPLDRHRHFRIRLIPHQRNQVIALVSPENFASTPSHTNLPALHSHTIDPADPIPTSVPIASTNTTTPITSSTNTTTPTTSSTNTTHTPSTHPTAASATHTPSTHPTAASATHTPSTHPTAASATSTSNPPPPTHKRPSLMEPTTRTHKRPSLIEPTARTTSPDDSSLKTNTDLPAIDTAPAFFKSHTSLPTLNTTPALLKELHCGVVIVDPQSYVLFANHTAQHLLAQENLAGQSLLSLFPHLRLKATGEQHVLRIGTPPYSRVLGYRCTSITSANQQEEIFISLSDLTQFEHLQREMTRLEKLAEMGRLSSMMIHEIRNPLAGIQAMIQSMRPDVASLGLDYAFDMITDEIKRLSHLLTEYSLLRGSHEPQRQQTDLRKVLDLVAFSCKHRLEHIAYNFELYKVPLLWVDPEQMRQLFLNLILNSLDALDASGRSQKRLHLSGRVHESNLLVEIEDNGCGIPTQDQQKIFDAFYTTKPHGTGLGLVICKKILKEHKGRIEIQSLVGQGTRVRIFLPLLEAT